MIGKVIAVGWAIVLMTLWPLSSLALKKEMARQLANRMELYRGAVASEVLLGLATLAADFAGPRAGVMTFWKSLPSLSFALWTLGTAIACAAAWGGMILEARRHPRHSDRMVLEMLPRTPSERRAFLGVSALAGLSEEYVVRGFCLGTIAWASGSMAAAYVLTTLAFGLGHLYQGWTGAARATVLGAILGIPVVATGTLIPSIVAHAATDMISGRWTPGLLGEGSKGQTPSAPAAG